MSKGSVLVVCLSPAFQQTSVIRDFHENEVNRAVETKITPAGKGVNVSRVLARLGTESVNLMQLGGPRLGEFIGLCEKYGAHVRHVDSERHIRNCVTIVNEKGGTSTELVEENPPVDPALNGKMMEAFRKEMPEHEVLVITGSAAKGFSDDLFARMTAEAKALGKTVILDIRGNALKEAIPARPDVIKPNLQEFMQTFRPEVEVMEEEDSGDLFDAVSGMASDIYREYGIVSVITRGKYATWYWDGGKLSSMEPKKVKAVNTIGCGDTFTASLADSALKGLSMTEAVRKAMDAASDRASRKELV